MDKKERRIRDTIVGTLVGILTLVGAASWYAGTRDYEAKSKLNTAIVKADTNRDGILQNSELVSMLKSVGCSQPIPENSNPLLEATRMNCPTYIDYAKVIDEPFSSRQQGVTVYLTEKDLDSYLSKN